MPRKRKASEKPLQYRYHPIDVMFRADCRECGRESPMCAVVLFGERKTRRVLCSACRLATNGKWIPAEQHSVDPEDNWSGLHLGTESFEDWKARNPPLPPLEDD